MAASPTNAIDRLRNSAAAIDSAPPSSQIAPARQGVMQGGSDQTNTGGAVILPHPTVLAAAPSTQYLDPNFDLDAVHIPFVRFAGIKRITPEREHFAVGWHAFVCEIASDPAPIVQSKDAVSYFIAGTLRDAELVNAKLRASRLAKGQSTIGRQRSSAHIASLGPAIFLDDDGDVFAREPALHCIWCRLCNL